MHPAILTALIVTAVLVAWIGVVLRVNWKTHPEGLFTLFFSEMWERFSFYGMRALLVLYMTKALLYEDDRAYGVYGAYGALVYATPALGGLIADRLIGYQRAIMLGAIFMSIGHFVMAVENEYFFYSALAFLIVGNGFFKPNISSLVGKLYPEGDARRDSGFTLFYMGINAGALLAPLWCGTLGEVYGWHYGFGLAGVGMLMGLIVFSINRKKFGERGLPPDRERLRKPIVAGINLSAGIVIAAVLAVPLMVLLVNQHQVMSPVLVAVGLVVVGYLLFVAFRSDKVERDRIFVILVLTLFSVMFWAFFEQAGSSINLFTDRNVNRTLAGYEIPTSQFQGVNPAFIILLAPLFSGLWVALAKRNKEPSTPLKFALGILLLGLGFAALVVGARTAGPTGKVALAFLVLAYFLHTTGELSLSPVGLSMVTKLSPAKLVGLAMGTWFLSSAFAHHVGGLIARLTAVPDVEGTAAGVHPAETLPIYAGVFNSIFWVALAVSLLLMLLVPVLKKWMHGVR